MLFWKGKMPEGRKEKGEGGRGEKMTAARSKTPPTIMLPAWNRGCGRGDFRDTIAQQVNCHRFAGRSGADPSFWLSTNRLKFDPTGGNTDKRAFQYAYSRRHPVGKCDRGGKEHFLPVINCCRGTHAQPFCRTRKRARNPSVSRFPSFYPL